MKKQNKPVIETMLNTSAIALSAFGTNLLIDDGSLLRGIALIALASGMEFYKYWGRKNNYW